MNARVQVLWVDPRRIIPLHEIRRSHHFMELVARMRKYGWQGRPLAAESLGEGRGMRLRPSGHFMGWTGTHRIGAAGVVAAEREARRLRPVRGRGLVPIVLVNHGRPSRRPLVRRTTTDPSRYKFLRTRRDPAAVLLRAELEINAAADRNGRL